MVCIQSITVLAPSFMYLGQSYFKISIFTALGALPFTLIFLLLIFELRIFFFGKTRRFYVIEAVHPEQKIIKWSLIFFFTFILYSLISSILFATYLIQNTGVMIIFLFITLLVGFKILFKFYRYEFPPTEKENRFYKK